MNKRQEAYFKIKNTTINDLKMQVIKETLAGKCVIYGINSDLYLYLVTDPKIIDSLPGILAEKRITLIRVESDGMDEPAPIKPVARHVRSKVGV